MNGRKRKVQIKFYVTEEERALIEQKMKLVPTQNMAAYLRKIAIDGYIIPFETYQMQQIRLMGTTADVGITNVTENQLVDISKSNLVLDVGIQHLI